MPEIISAAQSHTQHPESSFTRTPNTPNAHTMPLNKGVHINGLICCTNPIHKSFIAIRIVLGRKKYC